MQVAPLAKTDLEHVLDLTEPLWSEVRRQNLFITGGTGFFGMWLLESFMHINRRLSLGASATVLTRDPNRFMKRAPHVVHDGAIALASGDVRDFDFPTGTFPFIIHAGTAASLNVPHVEMLNTIIKGTQRTLEFAHEHGAQKLLFVSSGAVYGAQPREVEAIAEDFYGGPNQTEPGAAYAEGKRLGELLCAIQSKETDLQCKIARCFAFVGPHLPLDGHFAIGNFIRRAIAGLPIEVAGDGTPYRSYLYAADLAVWLWHILFNGKSMRPYNVGSQDALTIAEVARVVANCSDAVCKVSIANRSVDAISGSRYVPCVTRALEELNLSQAVSLSDAVRRTMQWHRSSSFPGRTEEIK